VVIQVEAVAAVGLLLANSAAVHYVLSVNCQPGARRCSS
jgi:hypothetical protein